MTERSFGTGPEKNVIPLFPELGGDGIDTDAQDLKAAAEDLEAALASPDQGEYDASVTPISGRDSTHPTDLIRPYRGDRLDWTDGSKTLEDGTSAEVPDVPRGLHHVSDGVKTFRATHPELQHRDQSDQ